VGAAKSAAPVTIGREERTMREHGLGRLTKTQRARIEQARDAAKMERARFAFGSTFIPGTGPGNLSGEKLDAWIKKTIRLYVEAWIIEPLDAVLEGDAEARKAQKSGRTGR
jgi:hypothetical protein